MKGIDCSVKKIKGISAAMKTNLAESTGVGNSRSTHNYDQSVSSLSTSTSKNKSSIVRGRNRSCSRLFKNVVEQKVRSTEVAQARSTLNNYLSNQLSHLLTCSTISALLKTLTSFKFESSPEVQNPRLFNKEATVLADLTTRGKSDFALYLA